MRSYAPVDFRASEHGSASVARQHVSTAHVTVEQTKPFSSSGEKGFLLAENLQCYQIVQYYRA